MRAALICREMKWTWQEYQEQPGYFIETLGALFNAESEAQQKKK